MTRSRIPLLCLLLALLVPVPARAICVETRPKRTRILTIRVDACQRPEAFSKDAAACVKARWLSRWQEQAVKRADGWVLRGTVVQTQDLVSGQDGSFVAQPPAQSDSNEVWFVAMPLSDTAPWWSTRGATVQFVVSTPCCDELPPAEFSCWFDLDELRPVPDDLKAVLAR